MININEKESKGYWIYSIFAITIGFGLFAFIIYLIYDLIIKLGTNTFDNMALMQSIITAVLTIFAGGLFSKSLEYNNNKKMELLKIRKEISLNIINLMGMMINDVEREKASQLLIVESHKVKIFFDDEILRNINFFIKEDKYELVDLITDNIKKFFS